jgi:FlaA1/EpsC-like NDP-sugar epimerase
VIKSSLNVLPGWMVLFMDFLILLHAGILSFLIIGNFNLVNFSQSGFLLGSTCFALLGMFASYIFNNQDVSSEENIINEIISITKTMVLTLTFFLVAHFGSIFLFDKPQFNGSFSFLVMISGFSVFGTLFFRLIIRQTIDYLNNQQSVQQKFLIIGNTSNSSITRKTIQKLGFPLQLIKAYVSESPVRAGQKILSAPVYNDAVDLNRLIEEHQITDVVLSPNLQSTVKKRAYIEQSLNAGIRPSIMKSKDIWTLNHVSSLGIKKVMIEDYLVDDQIILNDQHLYQYINRQTILLAGAGGNLGQEICRQLLFLNPAHIILLDQDEESLAGLENKIKALQLKTTITTVVLDIRNKSRLRTVFEDHRPDLVYNAAVFNDPSLMEVYSEEAIQIHVTGTKNLADLSKDFEVGRFILVSSDQAVLPREVTGASKRLAEMYVQHMQSQKTFAAKKTKFIIIRHGEILGVNDQVILNIKKDIRSGKPIHIHHPKTMKTFSSLAETVKFVLTSSILGQGGEIYVMDKNNGIQMVDLVKKIVQLDKAVAASEIRLHYNKNVRPIEGPTTYNKNTEYLLPTSYEDIFLAVPIKKEMEDLGEKIEAIESVLKQNNPITLIKYFKSIIPDFISNNKFIELSERLN